MTTFERYFIADKESHVEEKNPYYKLREKEEYAKRLDELFKSWNDGNKKSRKMKLIEYLFSNYGNDVTSNKEYYSVKVDDRITLLVDVDKLEILEFKTMYYNIDISSYHKLNGYIKDIQKEIDNIKLS